jgi:2-polyprenyl-3-methyl-5-hydroxy-6-metoxy-1,4-benzoquinol methylase
VVEGYGEDLAHIHDAGFGDVAAAASEWLIGRLRSLGIASGTVADLGCGSGQVAARLVQAGYSVLGVDISSAFIETARRRVPSATFVVESFQSVEHLRRLPSPPWGKY